MYYVTGKGLFKRAILQSGSALSSWAITHDPLRYTRQVADQVNCSHHWGDSAALLDCFKTKPVDELVNVEVSVTVPF